jgi:hypothetical protein
LKTVGWVDTIQDEDDHRKKRINVLTRPKNSGLCLIRGFLGSFSLKNLKKWFKEEQKYSSGNTVYIKESLTSQRKDNSDTCLNNLYETHYRDEYFEVPKELENDLKQENKPENNRFR